MATMKMPMAVGSGGVDSGLLSKQEKYTFAGSVTMNKDYKMIICLWDPNYMTNFPLLFNGSASSWDATVNEIPVTFSETAMTRNGKVGCFVKYNVKSGDVISQSNSSFASWFFYFE